MVAFSNLFQFDEKWNEIERIFQQCKVFADEIGLEIEAVLWIPVSIQLPTASLSCLVTVIDEEKRRFLLIAKFNLLTNSFVFAHIQLRPLEAIIAWAAIPRPYIS
jgi:hypothetical protein